MNDDALEEVLGFEITKKDLENTMVLEPKVKKEIEEWAKKSVNNPLNLQLKKCLVEIVDLNKTLEDFESELSEIENQLEEDDEEEDDDLKKYGQATEMYKEHLRIIKKNEEKCPNFRNCPLFINDALPTGGKCPIEVMKTVQLKDGFYNELEIKEDDFSDRIVVNHLVSTELLAQRALEALSIESLAKSVVTVNKNGGKTFDTKINDNFLIYQKTLEMSEKLRKNLILGRENRMKNKKLEQEINENSIKEKLKNKLSNFSATIDVAEIINEVANDEEMISIDG